jgi:hypothetical protein
VHFRAQIGQKCPLFASESAKKGVFCRGEGRLFGRPKTGVFGVRSVACGTRSVADKLRSNPREVQAHRAYSRKMCVSRASVATASLIMLNVIDIRSYPKGRRLNIQSKLQTLILFVLCSVVPRSVDYEQVATNKIKFVSRNDILIEHFIFNATLSPPIQRELTYAAYVSNDVFIVTSPKRPKTPYFGPTDIACLPGPKIVRNFRNFAKHKKNKYLFYFL